MAGSDSNDSDGFYSENEPDNPKEDTDFNQPHLLKRMGVSQREKSARLQERAAKRKKGGSLPDLSRCTLSTVASLIIFFG